jgi:hypothetical protein
MITTRADIKQDEFIESNGKLYVNFEQVEKTDAESQSKYWEMKTLEVAEKRTAYNEIIKYYEAESLRPLRELLIDAGNEFAKNKIAFINEQIAKYR